jgi:endonuclease YncB( thermonuclease family)
VFEIIDVKKGRMVANLPTINGRYATAGEAVSDGDTINAATEGLLQVRFCSIDTPEMGLTVFKNDVFGQSGYRPTEKFEEYLIDPFDKKYANSDDFSKALGENFIHEYLGRKLHENTAINHKIYAEKAREELRKLIEDDIRLSAQFGKDYYRFQIEFPYEVLDRYGRFLGWVKRFEYEERFAKGIIPYNDSMVEKGMAFPYLIWPSLSTSKRDYNLQQLVPSKDDFKELIVEDDRIKTIRLLAEKARKKKLGIFGLKNSDELLLPFELRFLVERNYGTTDDLPVSSITHEDSNDRSHKKPLFRYVINLSKSDNPVLMKPNQYYKIKNYEDRLFIPPEYVPLFREKGYEIEP